MALQDLRKTVSKIFRTILVTCIDLSYSWQPCNYRNLRMDIVHIVVHAEKHVLTPKCVTSARIDDQNITPHSMITLREAALHYVLGMCWTR